MLRQEWAKPAMLLAQEEFRAGLYGICSEKAGKRYHSNLGITEPRILQEQELLGPEGQQGRLGRVPFVWTQHLSCF